MASNLLGVLLALSVPPCLQPSLSRRHGTGSLMDASATLETTAGRRANAWSQLNSSVGGNLLVDVPPGAVCHNTFDGPLGTLQTYNAEECTNTTALFYNEQWT